MTSSNQDSAKIYVTVLSKTGEFVTKISVRKGSNLWVALRKYDIPVGASCSGVGVCGACDVQVLEGKMRDEKNDFEAQTLVRNDKDPNSRLACLCRVIQDVVVTADYW